MHVEALAEGSQDAGSIPAASILFAINPLMGQWITAGILQTEF